MDQPVVDRRVDARFPGEAMPTRATLRTGCVVALIDWSAGGALVQAPKPLRPGARVHLLLIAERRTFALAAHVLRCAVWSLDPHVGVTYRGALEFEDRCEFFWEAATRRGSAVPAAARPTDRVDGQRLPAHRGRGKAVPVREAE